MILPASLALVGVWYISVCFVRPMTKSLWSGGIRISWNRGVESQNYTLLESLQICGLWVPCNTPALLGVLWMIVLGDPLEGFAALLLFSYKGELFPASGRSPPPNFHPSQNPIFSLWLSVFRPIGINLRFPSPQASLNIADPAPAVVTIPQCLEFPDRELGVVSIPANYADGFAGGIVF